LSLNEYLTHFEESNHEKFSALFILIAAAIAAPAFAQSSVTMYGIISTGMFYTDNQKGLSNYGLLNGPQQPPRIGFIGQEDLGGGRKAFFTLENGFSITTGAAGQGGRLFGRQSFVGLSDAALVRSVSGVRSTAWRKHWRPSSRRYSSPLMRRR